jgi:spore coat protein U-like protein
MKVALRLALLMLLTQFVVTVSASAQACTDSALPLTFGLYSGTLLNGVGTVTVTCHGNPSWKLSLDQGLGAGATTTTRKMTGPAGVTLNYQLFQDSARTINWGNSSGSDTVTGTGNGLPQLNTVYGRVAAGQYVAPGVYSDTISASVTASGNTAAATITVNTTVVAACLVAALPMAFGTYSGAAVNSTSSISITCTNTTSYNVGLSAGSAIGATVSNRNMTGPASALLRYKLFRDAGRTLNWGNTVGTDTVSVTANGLQQTLTVYGQIPSGQYPRPGNYADTITATVTY